MKNEEKYQFPAGDPSFIGQKPAAYVIDLFQQREFVIYKGGEMKILRTMRNRLRSATVPRIVIHNYRTVEVYIYKNLGFCQGTERRAGGGAVQKKRGKCSKIQDISTFIKISFQLLEFVVKFGKP